MNGDRDTKEAGKMKEKDFKELLKSSIRERAIAVILNDVGARDDLTAEQCDTIARSFTEDYMIDEANLYVHIYKALLQYARMTEGAINKYKEETEKLTGLISKYETIESLRKPLAYIAYSFEYKKDLKRELDALKDDETAYSTISAKDFKQEEEDLKTYEAVKTFFEFTFNTKGGADCKLVDYKIKDINSGKVQAQIIKDMQLQSRETARALSALKSRLETIKKFLQFKNTRKAELWKRLTPPYLEDMIEKAGHIKEEEDETKQKYFKARLKERKDAGETVTKEEEKLAVYPDYNQVRQTTEDKEEAEKDIEQLIFVYGIK